MNKIYKFLAFIAIAGCFTTCNFKEQVDPNRPGVPGIATNANTTQMNELVVGMIAEMRDNLEVYTTASGSIARELYLFDADPRNTVDLLGRGGAKLDNNTFYLTQWYQTYYRVIKNGNLLLAALDNSVIIDNVSKEGYRGFVKTIQAHLFLKVLNMLGTNGVKMDVSDPDKAASYVTGTAAYTAILALLDQASTHLDAAGTTFPFTMSTGFTGFDAPATFKQFNRAIAARVALYQKDWSAVLTHLGNSFYSATGSLTAGPKHVFGTGAGDKTNPMFLGDAADNIYAHPSYRTDAGADSVVDLRIVNKLIKVDPAVAKDDLTGFHRQNLYPTNITPVDIIRNEELVLMAAEANIQLNNLATATTLINIVRSAAGLTNFTGTTQAELLTQLLKERRYSLWLEGHRMFDLRRYDMLNATNVPVDRTGDVIHTQFPIPLNDE